MSCLLGASALRASLPAVDPGAPSALSPRAFRLVGLGRDTATATALWIRTVDLHLSDRATPAQVAAAIRTIGVLDPTWVEPWFFGVLMLPPEAHGLRLELVEQAAQLHPDVPWFAWRAGMDRLGEDRPAALDWLRQAASAPGADPAYAELLRAIEERPR